MPIPNTDDATTRARLAAEVDLHYAVVLDDRFHLTLEDETALEFTISNNYGTVVSADPEVRIEFLVCHKIMGFEDLDRGNLGRTRYKLNRGLRGHWKKLVTYKEWIVRAIDETPTHWLLVANGQGAAEIGMAQVPGLNFYFKWAPKSEVVEETPG